MKIILMALLLGISTCVAAEWRLVTTSQAGDQFYVEPSFIKSDGGYIRVWSMMNYAKPIGDEIKSVKELSMFDCRGGRTKVLQTSYYSSPGGNSAPMGAPVEPSPPYDRWVYVAPDTAWNTVFNYACRGGR